jgi:hypothetical protein
MRTSLNLAALVMLASFGSAAMIDARAQAQTIQGMERKSQQRHSVRHPSPGKKPSCNASGLGTRTDCGHTRKAPREIDQDRVGMNTLTPPND